VMQAATAYLLGRLGLAGRDATRVAKSAPIRVPNSRHTVFKVEYTNARGGRRLSNLIVRVMAETTGTGLLVESPVRGSERNARHLSLTGSFLDD
jgi:hypothetical protein